VLENEALSFSLSESIRQMGRPNAADAIAGEAIALAKGPSSTRRPSRRKPPKENDEKS